MELSAVQELLGQIRTISGDLAARRGRHASALWSVHDFLNTLPGDLVPYEDSAPVHGTARLVVAPGDALSSQSGKWGLWIEDGGERVLAHRAEPHVQVAAVRRMGEFLTGFLGYLRESAGSKVSIEMAEQLVRATTPVIEAVT